jgi:uncharacterized membrane protein YfcA
MDDNAYMIAAASAVVFIMWKIVETKYVRKSTVNVKTIAVNAISVFVAVSIGSYVVGVVETKTAHAVGVFTSDPDF